MKTFFLIFKKSETTLCAMRFALIVGILVFTVSMGKSQTSNSIPDSKKTRNTDTNKVESVSNDNNNTTSTTKNNSACTSNKIGQHAPEMSDPNYEAKKIEWIKNYPEEYNASLEKSSVPNGSVNNGTTSEVKHPNSDYPQKLAEHAPDINDPDYEAKKAEWINNYPQEYEQLTNSTSGTTKESNEKIQSVSNPQTIPAGSSITSTSVINKKMGDHAPDINDPNFEAKKADWIKNYPEEYNACLKNASKPNTGMSTCSTPALNKTGIKVAEHAPDLNDTDYEAKKAAWIKNYPEEYNAQLNKASNSNSSINVTTPVLNQPAKNISGQSSDMATPGYDATKANKNK